METKNHNAIDYYIDVEPVLTSEARLHHTVCESVLKNVDHLDLRKVAPGCARKLSPSDNVTFFKKKSQVYRKCKSKIFLF